MTTTPVSTALNHGKFPRKALAGICFGAVLALSSQAHAGLFDWLRPKKDDYTQTRYPIVLAHGLFGFSNIAGIDYWHGIPNELRKSGAQVYIGSTSAANSNEVLGEQLIEQLDDWAASSGAQKFNLIGHSQGGGTIRYVAAVRPDLVASVTTIGSSHKGSGVADALTLIPEGSLIQTAISEVVNVFARIINLIGGNSANRPQQSLAALGSLSSKGAEDFNRRFPLGIPTTACGEGVYQANGMRFYSWTGDATATALIRDPSDSGMISGAVVNKLMGKGDSDGMAPVCGAHFGKVIRDNYHMNHLDEVNQIVGATNMFETSPITLYRAHANRLKNEGL
ncbi:lipase family alpha/beta hydrolase [Pseudomonas sp. 5P_3.1_Bac2]|uniref:lipase family alpha/beta hydrolase n=1 Tax=Pseudomonas sp. 5P_3.1_Bac2 TaxID=2971617 RepID=UPI0021C96295|nr:triacylglycerol lipase [Pseudomonas sp. 5P_3.1_Bac2]MCU1716110.1 triacylglycerol lipase [Pseudomonas sp. 5P_3.1_Bac2]